MDKLNKICNYWYECIIKEDILEKDISINVRTKAVLYPFDKDSFIFNKSETKVVTSEEKITRFATTKISENSEFFYGFPLLFYSDYYNNENGQDYVAPLLMIKVKFLTQENNDLVITKDEPYPIFGIQALTKLGLRTEEIAEANKKLEKLFMSDTKLNSKELLDEALNILKNETSISINEEIDPTKLTNTKQISKGMNAGLYNKSMLFAGENTVYNVHLLKDLLDLRKKTDLNETALGYLFDDDNEYYLDDYTPILPFKTNEYQTSAIKNIGKHKISVITGPPGTGKSQLISNLIINLFLNNKTVLFVSHTGDAVDVVNTKINDNFKNLMIRTGNKEFRQDLKNKYKELLTDSNHNNTLTTNSYCLNTQWDTITEYRNSLLLIDGTEQQLLEHTLLNKHLESIIVNEKFFLKKFFLYIKKYFLIRKITSFRKWLESNSSKIEIEKYVRELEDEYYEDSMRYVKDVFIDKILGDGKNTGAANRFLNDVTEYRYKDKEDYDKPMLDSLKILRIWSTTLKSLRATFPLKPRIFDYVIFDEASQIDLPSAAPALYRAKKAIVVGDPMQLTHIAGITKKMDLAIAKKNELNKMKEVYPYKTRYCDISLYKSAENSLNQPPILLMNHYRSEEQIIALCNRVFYKDKLKIQTSIDYSKLPSKLPTGLHWIDVEGISTKHRSGSRVNYEEVNAVVSTFKQIWELIEDSSLTIGIVTPYNRQRQEIFNRISHLIEPELIGNKVRVLTAHRFQGSEADIIIFSLVLSSKGDGNSDSWYNNYPQILNVGLSRARMTLYIVGDKQFCLNRKGVLKKIATTFDQIQKESTAKELTYQVKFDTPYERKFYNKLQKQDLESFGYELLPQYFFRRYTLDFALLGKKKIAIEIDGIQHEVIEGLPIIEDVERDSFMEDNGWKVIRIPNYKIVSDIDCVVKEVMKIIKKSIK